MFKPRNDLKYQVKHIIDFYSHIDENGERSLKLSKVPDFEIDDLCSLIMICEPELAYEACSVDNNVFLHDMLPSLVCMMSKDHKISKEDFSQTWKEGIRSYLMNRVQKLVTDEIEHQNTCYPVGRTSEDRDYIQNYI